MESLHYVKPQSIRLKGHSEFAEKWVQDRIVEDPSILGLGDLELKDVERLQPKAVNLSETHLNRRPTISLSILQAKESYAGIMSVFEWMIGDIRKT